MIVVVKTLGCKVNESESQTIIENLIQHGFEISEKFIFADIYIINTCAVTNTAFKKSLQMIHKARCLNQNAKIFVIGCASELTQEEFRIKGTNYIFGVKDKFDILPILYKYQQNINDKIYSYKDKKVKGYIKIQDGCNNFCSYCIIPYLRGREKDKSYNDIIKEIQTINTKEIVLDGINIAKYNYNNLGLTGLINELKNINARIRLGSLEICVINNDFLMALKQLQNFSINFHLSLQSGSDYVLKKMNRHYTTEEFYQKVLLIRKYFNNASITTDIIVGYPCETKEMFQETLEFVKKIQFSKIHVFPFSKRPMTVAYSLQELDKEEIKTRTQQMLQISNELKIKYMSSLINSVDTVLIESHKNMYYIGYTNTYVKTYIKYEKYNQKYINTFVNVKLLNIFNDGMIGNII